MAQSMFKVILELACIDGVLLKIKVNAKAVEDALDGVPDHEELAFLEVDGKTSEFFGFHLALVHISLIQLYFVVFTSHYLNIYC